MKRFIDILLASFGLIMTAPILLPVMFLIWKEDKHSPFYVAPRVGRNGQEFKMVKLRSMVVNADKSGVDSTSASDRRITPVGKFIRRFKLDEFSQLWNVLKGDMSLVGPRPNVKRETDLYTAVEQELLSVQPGITDFASIVFADEGEILKNSRDPDIDYHQLIRPWKSRLGLFYIKHRSLSLDLKLIVLTALAIFSRAIALQGVGKLLHDLKADSQLIQISRRNAPLEPYSPPGATEIVVSRATVVNS